MTSAASCSLDRHGSLDWRRRGEGCTAVGVAGPVGRDDVLARLRSDVDAAVDGRGQFLLLTGEAGIGKTTMLIAAGDYAASRGVRVAWGFHHPGYGAPVYSMWRQVFDALDLEGWPSITDGSPEDPGAQRFRLFDAVTAALLAESRIQSVAVLLDDLQWADDASILLLAFLVRRLPAGALVVVAAHRDVAGPTPDARDLLPQRAEQLPLRALSAGAVEDLVARLVGAERAAQIAPELLRRTGGNPFFVTQLALLFAVCDPGSPSCVRRRWVRLVCSPPWPTTPRQHSASSR
ncbi:MAG: AAA family ATPase [Actinomycetes bacterium]